ncbi:uncharacterized protein LOC108179569 [Tachysurus ichikawai]
MGVVEQITEEENVGVQTADTVKSRAQFAEKTKESNDYKDEIAVSPNTEMVESEANHIVSEGVDVGVSDGITDAKEDRSKEEDTVDVEMRDEDTLSDISDAGSQVMEDMYSIDETNDFLDTTFSKVIYVKDFFSDVDKFITMVLLLQKSARYDVLDKKKRLRLKKMITKLKKSKAPNPSR